MRQVLQFIQRLIGLALLALALAAIVGPAVMIEVAGAVAPGTIVQKREVVDYGTYSASWTHRQFIDVRYQPSDVSAPETTEIALTPTMYDRLRVGQAVQVRYATNVSLRPYTSGWWARLTTQPPMGAFLARMGTEALWFGPGLLAWLALLWLWSKWRNGWLALFIALVAVGALLYFGSNAPLPQPVGALLSGQATVRDTRLITKVWGGRRSPAEDAVQPFVIAQLVFVPQGMTDAVVAVDQVDQGSVPGLANGATVPIHYSATNTRWAQIDGATRTYYWKNLRTFAIIALLLVVLVGGGWLTGRKRRAARMARQQR